ncbi:MAG: hypothetical protein OZ921_12315 [Sorangiineae bacterium]|nr:hypothetical protein [Polyangiaceae bacterium]MEB2323290.1 hypothetical protein [Sorangiineae bacterium]
MRFRDAGALTLTFCALAGLSGCGSNEGGGAPADPHTNPGDGAGAGWPDGHATIPAEARAEDVSSPTTVVGTGTRESCTGAAFVAAVAKGGVITFDCGPDPVTITLAETAKVFNDRGSKLVIDGGGKVTLSGGGKVRILYMSTCDEAQTYPPGPGDCNTNPGVELVVQNLTFIDGSARGISDDEGNAGGGGAIYAQGGSLKVVGCRFFNNVCDELGSDVGGGAIRKLDYLIAPGAGPARPAWVVGSTFGGSEGMGNSCANGGALSSIGVSWNILDSLFSFNTAVGHGANSGQGGNGGAIYNDGNEIIMNLESSLLEDNRANEGGSAVFFVSNDRSGTITIKDSLTRRNPRGTFETPDLPGFFVLAKAPAKLENSQIER